MNDEPVGNKGTGQRSNQQSPSVPITPEGSQKKETANDSVQKNTRKRAIKAYWLKLHRAGLDRHIELGLAAAIALFAAIQLVVTCSNNRSTSKQVDKIIKAANDIGGASKQIKEAATQFAGSAGGINSGVGTAVNKLNDQANKLGSVSDQMSRLANETARANSNALDADRPWMGGFIQVADFVAGKKPTYTVVFTNSGRRPARITLTANRENLYRGFPSDPDKEYMFDTTPSTNIIVPGQIVVSTQTADGEVTQPELDFLAEQSQVTFFIFAKCEYVDIRTNKQHWTHICMRYLPKFKSATDSGFRSCSEYNEVDNNP